MIERVVHFKKSPYDVYIGRPSEWGNPYSHLDDSIDELKVSTREEAISKYRVWLIDRVKNEAFKQKLMELDGKVLGCWCKPKDCHGDVIIEVINMIKLGII